MIPPVLASFLAQQTVPPRTEACGPPGRRPWLCDRVFDVTHNVGVSKVAHDVSGIVTSIVIVVAAYLTTRIVRVVIRRVVRRLERDTTAEAIRRFRRRTGLAMLDTSRGTPTVRRHQRAQTIGAGLRSVASIVIWTIAIVLVLGALGVRLGPLLAGAGLIGVALGFGAQTMVRDFLAGMFMIFEDQFGVGDIVDVGDATGTVEQISLRVTRLRDVEGVVWHVPNGEIHRVGNMSQQWSRALLDLSVAYDTDIPTAKRIIKETADALAAEPGWSHLVLDEPEVWGVQTLGADAIDVRLVLKTRPLEQWKVARELRERIKAAFDAAGIEIPFAQRTVWHRVEPGTTLPGVPVPGDDGDPGTDH